MRRVWMWCMAMHLEMSHVDQQLKYTEYLQIIQIKARRKRFENLIFIPLRINPQQKMPRMVSSFSCNQSADYIERSFFVTGYSYPEDRAKRI